MLFKNPGKCISAFNLAKKLIKGIEQNIIKITNKTDDTDIFDLNCKNDRLLFENKNAIIKAGIINNPIDCKVCKYFKKLMFSGFSIFDNITGISEN